MSSLAPGHAISGADGIRTDEQTENENDCRE